MASMSYCVIENVCGDLATAVNKFTHHQEDIQSNQYERACTKNLYDLCKEYVEAYEEYEEDPKAYIEEHSNADDEDE